MLLGRRHGTLNFQCLRARAFRVAEDMQLGYIQSFYEFVGTLKQLFTLATRTHNDIHPDERIGQHLTHLRYLTGKECRVVTAVHKLENLIATRLQRNVEMWHEAARLRNIFSLIWRGPMACNALKQMILQVRWGELDFLLIDMPPGTGDIHISLVHDIPLEGAVIVSTPQDVALADVEKGVNMFRNESVNKPIFGLVENMAWFTPAEHPDEKYYIFGQGGGLRMAEKYGIPLLGQIPIVQSIREGGDAGEPAALSSRPDGLAFIALAEKLAGLLKN